MFKILISLDPFEQKVKRFEEQAEAAVVDTIQRTFDSSMKEGVDEAKTNHTYKDGPNRTLTQSIGLISTWTDDGAEGFLEATAEHASFVEEGTPPHDIWPKSSAGQEVPLKKGQSRRKGDDIGTTRVALRWFPDGGDTPRFARMVHHPGSSPMPFLAPAAEVVERDLVEKLERRIPTALRRVFKMGGL